MTSEKVDRAKEPRGLGQKTHQPPTWFGLPRGIVLFLMGGVVVSAGAGVLAWVFGPGTTVMASTAFWVIGVVSGMLIADGQCEDDDL